MQNNTHRGRQRGNRFGVDGQATDRCVSVRSHGQRARIKVHMMRRPQHKHSLDAASFDCLLQVAVSPRSSGSGIAATARTACDRLATTTKQSCVTYL